MEIHSKLGLIIKEKPVKALITMRRENISYASHVREKIDTPYAHTCKIMAKLEDAEMIEVVDEEGRKKKYEITEKGKEMADKLMEMNNAAKGLQIK